MENLYNELRNANNQFSGILPGVIGCFLPEIESFENLNENSALFQITKKFFFKSAKENIHSVIYSSDSSRDEIGKTKLRSSPAIKIENPKYNKKFGEMPNSLLNNPPK